MVNGKKAFANVDEYIANFDNSRHVILKNIRKIILKNAPGAIKVILFQMTSCKFQ
jgi:hypothetical protein